jgi:hypothetical protein
MSNESVGKIAAHLKAFGLSLGSCGHTNLLQFVCAVYRGQT